MNIKEKVRKISILAVFFGIAFFGVCRSGEAYAKSVKTLTISSADVKSASQVDEILNKGKAVNLKVRAGSVKAADKLVKALAVKTGKINKQGILFHTGKAKKSGAGYLYAISEGWAKAYKNNVKFCKKIFSYYKRNSLYNDAYRVYAASGYKDGMGDFMADALAKHDSYLFPPEDGQVFREEDWGVTWDNYDYMKTLCDYGGSDGAVGGNDILFVVDPDHKMHMYGLSSDRVTYKMIPDETVEEACAFEAAHPFLTQNFNTFWACKTACDNHESWEDIWDDFYSNQVSFLEFHGFDRGNVNAIGYALEAENFGDLSDAMKVFVFGSSLYFDCRDGNEAYGQSTIRVGEYDVDYLAEPYGMTYDWDDYFEFDDYSNLVPQKMSKKLLNGTARGVCGSFANYECFIFRQLGIEAYYQTGHPNGKQYLAHAWSVVKVKNSSGKTIWVPFDYGIGLRVVKNYKQAYAGIKGAPKKKGFEWTDFD